MKTIIANNSRGVHEIIVNDEDVSNILRHHWNVNSNGYAIRSFSKDNKSKQEYLHHYIIGKPAKGFVVDHINGNRLDNRRENLRIISHRDNLMNRGANKNSATGIKGVVKCKQTGKYIVTLSVNGKVQWLGRHETIEMASKIYKDAVKLQLGELVHTN